MRIAYKYLKIFYTLKIIKIRQRINNFFLINFNLYRKKNKIFLFVRHFWRYDYFEVVVVVVIKVIIIEKKNT